MKSGRQDTRSVLVLATTAASAAMAAQSTVTIAVVPRGWWPRRQRRGVLAAGGWRLHMVPTKSSLLHRLRGPVPGSGCRGACGRSGFGSMYYRVQARAVGSRAECRCVGGALVVGPAAPECGGVLSPEPEQRSEVATPDEVRAGASKGPLVLPALAAIERVA